MPCRKVRSPRKAASFRTRGKALADPLPPEVGRVDAAVGGDRSGAGPKPAPALPGAAVEFASPAGAWRPVMKGAAGSDVPSPGAQAPAASGGRILDAAPPLPAPASALQTAPPAAVSKAGGGSGEVTEANGPAPRPSVPDVRHAAGDLTPDPAAVLSGRATGLAGSGTDRGRPAPADGGAGPVPVFGCTC